MGPPCHPWGSRKKRGATEIVVICLSSPSFQQPRLEGLEPLGQGLTGLEPGRVAAVDNASRADLAAEDLNFAQVLHRGRQVGEKIVPKFEKDNTQGNESFLYRVYQT